ncbi:MAG: RidA family protein [Vicinamibacterales bacterium]
MARAIRLVIRRKAGRWDTGSWLVGDATSGLASCHTRRHSLACCVLSNRHRAMFSTGRHAPKACSPETPMQRRLISSGSSFEEQIGYSRAVVQGPFVFVSGTSGFDYESMTIDPDVAVQTEQCLENIDRALREAGSSLKDLVRVTYVLPAGEDFEKCGPVLKRYLGSVRPAAMMISAKLLDPRMKIEIEATAMKQSSAWDASGT